MKQYLTIGDKHGRCTVVRHFGDMTRKGAWELECDCGKHFYASADNILRGRQYQCRVCKNKARALNQSESLRETNALNPNKDNHLHPLYWVWNAMKQRCNNPNEPYYHRYGGRGITYDPTWESFLTYAADIATLGPKPSPFHSLDRRDNDGNYVLSNMRWATAEQQANNRG